MPEDDKRDGAGAAHGAQLRRVAGAAIRDSPEGVATASVQTVPVRHWPGPGVVSAELLPISMSLVLFVRVEALRSSQPVPA